MLYCHVDSMNIHELFKRSYRRSRIASRLSVLAVGWLSLACPIPGHAADGAFDQVAAHVRRQIATDKLFFAEADRCTNWFYRRHRPQSPPGASGVLWQPADEETACRAKYPKGLEEARADFARTQSALSLSLTFFELVHVADRNDDLRYSSAELADLLDALEATTAPLPLVDAQVTALLARFDSVHGSGNLEMVMRSLSTLFDKGYRFTPEDQAAVRGVTG